MRWNYSACYVIENKNLSTGKRNIFDKLNFSLKLGILIEKLSFSIECLKDLVFLLKK